jgi:hypothetical protein
MFDDGSSNVANHAAMLKKYVEDSRLSYVEPYDVERVRGKIRDSYNSYSGLVADGELLGFVVNYNPDLSVFVAGDSRFSARMSDVVYHTTLFRDLLVAGFYDISFTVEDVIEPYPLKELYYAETVSDRDSALKYSILKSNIESNLESI